MDEGNKPSRRRSGEKDGYWTYHCKDCGVEVYGPVKSIRCPACQWEARKADAVRFKARKAAGKSRKIGEFYPCEACGQMYELRSGLQRYCKACAPIMTSLNVSRAKKIYMKEYNTTESGMAAKEASRPERQEIICVCAVCGHEFRGTKRTDKYCSEDCKKTAQKEYLKEYDAQRRAEKSRAAKEKWAKTTPEEREEHNRRARERYAARKAREKQKTNNH